jgi:catechol 2,3-dioxygenase-like lactoylglutathione lyase family enzyme
MELAKPQADVGIFTNNLEAMQAFYGRKLGLEFESMLPVGSGMRQYRYLANGSVIKLMHSRDPLKPRQIGGYGTIMIATQKVTVPQALADPDDNTVELVPPGTDNVTQLEVRIGVSDVGAFDRFYTQAIGAQPIGGNRYKIGETIFGVYHEPGARTVAAPPLANVLQVVQAMAALGVGYVTLRVRSCDDAFRQLTSAGASAAIAPENFGTVARVSFVRDPDGNFIELAQRPPS